MDGKRHVLVGIDGEEGGRIALRYGAQEASRLGIGLHLLHVWPDARPLIGDWRSFTPAVASDNERMGRRILDEHAAMARDLAPGVEVATTLVHGDRVAHLVIATNRATLTVLGDESQPLLDKILVGTVLTGVAGKASAPVVIVPAAWSGAPEPQSARTDVVVAVKSCAGSAELVRRAMQIASDRQAPLTLVHAWRLPLVYDDVIADRVGEDGWEEAARTVLRAVVDSVRRDVPDDLEVRIDVRHGQPARALVDASENASLLLLGRRSHGFASGHLGATSRAVLRAVSCPVEVLPELTGSEGLPGLVLEEGGGMLKAAEHPETITFS